jgi:hypothetical protein
VKKRFALLLGGPHAGTTRLFRKLGRLPQVLCCRVMEPRFFTDDRKWQLGPDWYRSLWEFREPDERVAIEASQDYARHPLVSSPAARVARMPAGFRFVWMLREPVARVAAWHAARVAEGMAEPATDLRGLEMELVASRHATQLAVWREHFPEEDFLLLAHEEWLEAPGAALARVCRFLEIDPGHGFGEPAPDEVSAPARKPGRLARWLGRPGSRGAASPGREAPRLPERVEEALERELAPERERLEREWGFAPPSWRRREAP